MNDSSTPTTELIRRASGRNTTGHALALAIQRRWESHNEALEEAGIFLGTALPLSQAAQWDEESFKLALTKLNEHGFSLSWQSLKNEKDNFLLLAVLEYSFPAIGSQTVHQLIGYGLKRFGSWDEALKASGFSPLDVRKQFFFKNKAQVRDALKHLFDNLVDLKPSRIRVDRSEATAKLIYEATGVYARGATLYNSARTAFGTYRKAIEEADIVPEDVYESTEIRTEVLQDL